MGVGVGARGTVEKGVRDGVLVGIGFAVLVNIGVLGGEVSFIVAVILRVDCVGTQALASIRADERR